MVSTSIQLIAISLLASTNVWLAWWDVRLLTYSQTVSKAIPGASSYSGLDPILEVPAAFVLGFGCYLLGYRSTYALWKRRHSHYRDDLTTNALTINVVILLLVSTVGIVEWLTLYGGIPTDLIAVVVLGVVAVIVSVYLEKRPRWPTPLQYLGLDATQSTRWPKDW